MLFKATWATLIFNASACSKNRFINTTSYICNISNKMVVTEVRHLKKGDVEPAFKSDLPRLYSMRFCPYAQRVHLILDTKKIRYETVNVNLTEKPDFIFKKSVGGLVPVLEYSDGRLLFESLIVAEYLEEQHPEPNLLPKDPYKKALDKLFVEKYNRVIKAFYRIALREINEQTEKELNDSLRDVVESELEKRGTNFLGGTSRPGWIDLMIWPWLERLEMIEKVTKIDWSSLNKLRNYLEYMRNDEGVKVSVLPCEHHQRYLASRLAGNTEYDFLVAKL